MRYLHSPQEVVRMKHPFKTGDLVRSTMNRENLALVTDVHNVDGEPYVDVKYVRGNHVQYVPVCRFTLLSRTE